MAGQSVKTVTDPGAFPTASFDRGTRWEISVNFDDGPRFHEPGVVISVRVRPIHGALSSTQLRSTLATLVPDPVSPGCSSNGRRSPAPASPSESFFAT
jgi:hypothetical protein